MILAALMIALQLADVYTTRRFLAHGYREMNPLIRKGIERFGFWPTMAVKLVLGVAVALFLAWIGWAFVLAVLCAVYAAVVWNNWRLVR